MSWIPDRSLYSVLRVSRMTKLRFKSIVFSQISHLHWRRVYPAFLRRKAFNITDTELNAIATLAITGLNNQPNTG